MNYNFGTHWKEIRSLFTRKEVNEISFEICRKLGRRWNATLPPSLLLTSNNIYTNILDHLYRSRITQ